MQLAMKFLPVAALAVGLLGSAQSSFAQNPVQGAPQATTTKTNAPYIWHDGSSGGAFGIGEGWQIDIQPPGNQTITETVTIHDIYRPLIILPAEYEWVKDATVEPQEKPTMVSRLVVIPATYRMVTETVTVEPSRKEYILFEPSFNPDGTINQPAIIKEQHIEAVTAQKERRVIDSPARTEMRLIPQEHRAGYRRVVRVPERTTEDPRPSTIVTTRDRVIKTPAKFHIKNPHGKIVHSFESYDSLRSFTDSLKT